MLAVSYAIDTSNAVFVQGVNSGLGLGQRLQRVDIPNPATLKSWNMALVMLTSASSSTQQRETVVEGVTMAYVWQQLSRGPSNGLPARKKRPASRRVNCIKVP